MIPGVRGSLITATFAQSLLETLPGAAEPPETVTRALDVWSERRESDSGPAMPIRALTEAVVIPLLNILGFDMTKRVDGERRTILEAAPPAGPPVPVLVTGWSDPLDRAWRDAVIDGARADARWCFCINGQALRVVDAQRTWSRAYLEFDLALVARTPLARILCWSVLRAEALAATPPVLDRAVVLSAQHGAATCRALGRGVVQALELLFEALHRGRRHDSPAVFQQSLTVLYRVLFLLFAEARGLVPVWHPVYRDRYSIDVIIGALLEGRRCTGIWQAVVAISRLAHAGCSIGELKVTPFNGRLFSPAQSTAFDRRRVGDEVMARAIMAVGTNPRSSGLERIAYRDLDVEQLGAVYEHLLDYQPASGAPALDRSRDARKSTGTFYTPRAVTAYLVRATLEPLVRGRGPEDILALRVLDLAMGSGAFLVGACRYLASAMEDALIAEGRWHRGDVTAADRAALKRDIAQRCLFGADVNPMAVQLARLSLWLVTLASDKPLTFLDHHLVTGDSLVGASPDDLLRQPPGGRSPARRQEHLPLFDRRDLGPMLESAVRTRVTLASAPDDSAAVVHDKERTLAALQAPRSPLGRWSRVLDLWCAGWFWDAGVPPDPGAFADLCERLLHDRSSLPAGVADGLLRAGHEVAERQQFLHWPLAFPEVFCDDRGAPAPRAGFDAVIGNPPWDMVRGDSGAGTVRDGRKSDAHRLTAFVREAGIYQVESRAHVNRYQLFVERALQLTRPGGRIGLVLPAGIVTDTGAGPLRRHLFQRAAVDTVTGLDNRGGLFPIHRSTRFALLTCTTGTPTTAIACRFGISKAEDLEELERRAPLIVTRRLLSRLSGDDDLGIPELAGEQDLRIVERITAGFPALGSPDGWNVHFGRELNASDDRGTFVPYTGARDARPVLEGKQIEPFRAALDLCSYERPDAVSVPPVPRRARLAYRDIASATNRLTLIAAIVPARAVTTHTLFCLKTPLDADAQHLLCGLLNSFVANYFVRLRVNTHVTVSLVSRLPVPTIDSRSAEFSTLARLSRTIAGRTEPPEQMPEYPELQARVAKLYRLSTDDFRHVLGTFPLIPLEVRSAVLTHFTGLY